MSESTGVGLAGADFESDRSDRKEPCRVDIRAMPNYLHIPPYCCPWLRADLGGKMSHGLSMLNRKPWLRYRKLVPRLFICDNTSVGRSR
eukprot:6256888-Pyramimonas_sp.AAC.1